MRFQTLEWPGTQIPIRLMTIQKQNSSNSNSNSSSSNTNIMLCSHHTTTSILMHLGRALNTILGTKPQLPISTTTLSPPMKLPRPTTMCSRRSSHTRFLFPFHFFPAPAQEQENMKLLRKMVSGSKASTMRFHTPTLRAHTLAFQGCKVLNKRRNILYCHILAPHM